MSKHQQIIDAAIDEFYTHGLAVPAAKIAKQAGVSNGTLFNYFETKQLLIDAVYFSISGDIAELFGQRCSHTSLQEVLRNRWHIFVAWALANPKEFEVSGLICSSNALSEDMREQSDKLFQCLRSSVEASIEAGELVGISVDFLCELCCAQLRAIVAYASRLGMDLAEAKELVDLAFDIHWRGISAQ